MKQSANHVCLFFSYDDTGYLTKYVGLVQGLNQNEFWIQLRGNIFVCGVISTKSVQNLKSFSRTTYIRFVLQAPQSLGSTGGFSPPPTFLLG